MTRGLAGPGLLDSYAAEREPISALTVEQAYTRYVLRVDPSLPQDDLQQPLDDASIELGATYRSAAVHDAGSPAAPLDDPRSASWAPGTRMPHHPITVDRHEASTVDLVSRGFALLVSDAMDGWGVAAEKVRQSLGVPIVVQPIDAEVTGWLGAALVRPDGVVAWRTGEAADTAELEHVLAALLAVGEGSR